MAAVIKVLVRASVLRMTLEVLQKYGRQGCEGLVLWVGHVQERTATITRAIVPSQNPIKEESGVGYFVTGETLFLLNRTLADSGFKLIAQVHSHPAGAYHSQADDRYSIVTAEGGLSFVVPNFGNAPADPSLWAVYRLVDGRWCELTSDQVRSIITIVG